MVGGINDAATTEKVFFFDWPHQVWTQVQEMSVPRDLHSCALLTGMNAVIAIGGSQQSGDSHSTSEIFDLESESWSMGPALPRGNSIFGAQAVPYMGSLLLIGGRREEEDWMLYEEEIYQLDLETMEFVKRPEELQIGRHDHIAIPIPLGSCAKK